MSSIGDLVATLVADSAQWKSGLSSAKSSLSSFASYASGALAGIAASFASVDFAKQAIAAAESDVKATAKFESVLSATGSAAGVTSDEISQLASDLQRLTAFEDDATMNAAALLATFKNINGDQFKEVLKLAQDLAAVKGIDLDTAVQSLGKALTQGANGVDTLKKANVFLTESQIAVIDKMQATGGEAAAQAEMIRILQETYGGAAERTVTATEKINLALGDITESYGKKLLPAVELFASVAVPAIYDVVDAQGELETGTKNAAGSWGNWLAAAVNAMIPVKSGIDTILAGIGMINGAVNEPPALPPVDTLAQDPITEAEANVEQLFAESFTDVEKAGEEFEANLQRLADEWDILKGKMTEGELAARKALEAGHSEAAAEELRKRIDENKELRDSLAETAKLEDRVKAIRESVMTPEEKAAAEVADLQALRDAGDIDNETFARAKKKAEEGLVGDSKGPAGGVGAAAKGSAEAMSAIFTAMRGKDDKQLQLAETQVEQGEEMVTLLRDVRDGIGDSKLTAGSLT